MKKTKQTILVIGARAPIALELVRSFGQKGHRVLCGDSLHFPASRFSKYTSAYIHLPPPAFELNNFKEVLSKAIKKYNIDHIIPTSEEAFYLSKIADKLNCKVWISPIELMDELHNKFRFIKLAKKYFHTPKTLIYSEFKDALNTEKYVFKPIYSRFGRSVLINKKWEEITPKIKHSNQWIAQENINGELICLYAIFDQAQLKSIISYQPKFQYKGGASMLFKPQLKFDLYKKVSLFGKEQNYTGQISFDFIIRDNKAYVIECNPRGTSGAHLLSNELCESFLNTQTIKLKETYEIKALKLPILMDNPLAFVKKEYRDAKDVIFQWSDLKPFFGQFLSVFEFVYRKFKIGISLSDSMTYDIEYNGENI